MIAKFGDAGILRAGAYKPCQRRLFKAGALCTVGEAPRNCRQAACRPVRAAVLIVGRGIGGRYSGRSDAGKSSLAMNNIVDCDNVAFCPVTVAATSSTARMGPQTPAVCGQQDTDHRTCLASGAEMGCSTANHHLSPWVVDALFPRAAARNGAPTTPETFLTILERTRVTPCQLRSLRVRFISPVVYHVEVQGVAT